MRSSRITGRKILAGLLCLSLMVWSILPAISHVPTIGGAAPQHVHVVSEHGHSHGFVEELLWAMHGHSHDSVSHDHSPAIMLLVERASFAAASQDAWPLRASLDGPRPVFRIERPPRA